MSDTPIDVFIDLPSFPEPVQAGRLWSHFRKGRESASFEYNKEWLANPHRFALEPLLPLADGTFHTNPGQSVFGAIGDSTPDRWGRILMRRAELARARTANKSPHTLSELDYLLRVNDEARQGALRFSQDGGQSFCAPPGSTPIPPLVNLSRLLHAADHFCRDDENAEDLRLLLAPGSSLGGARPKASVKDKKGNLCIAKFPRHDDEYNVVAWEAVALTLASKAGLQVPRFELEKITDKDVLIIWRFDRTREQRRISYLSAMSMLGARDNEQHSYLEIVDAIRQYGAAPRQDLRQLWQRIAFSVMISNTDDHLRNHGFLQTGGTGWSLSPLFDVNPTPEDIRPRYLNTAIDWEDTSASLDVLLSIAPECGIKTSETNDLLEPIARAVSQWRQVAESFGISKQEQERMASAFEHKEGYAGVSA